VFFIASIIAGNTSDAVYYYKYFYDNVNIRDMGNKIKYISNKLPSFYEPDISCSDKLIVDNNT